MNEIKVVKGRQKRSKSTPHHPFPGERMLRRMTEIKLRKHSEILLQQDQLDNPPSESQTPQPPPPPLNTGYKVADKNHSVSDYLVLDNLYDTARMTIEEDLSKIKDVMKLRPRAYFH